MIIKYESIETYSELFGIPKELHGMLLLFLQFYYKSSFRILPPFGLVQSPQASSSSGCSAGGTSRGIHHLPPQLGGISRRGLAFSGQGGLPPRIGQVCGRGQIRFFHQNIVGILVQDGFNWRTNVELEHLLQSHLDQECGGLALGFLLVSGITTDPREFGGSGLLVGVGVEGEHFGNDPNGFFFLEVQIVQCWCGL